VTSTLWSYQHPSLHQNASDIIRRHSTNQNDVRQEALKGLDLSAVSDVLELGCGFGFMAEEVAGRVRPDARVVGVDACAANEGPFLERVTATGRRAEFVLTMIEDTLPFPAQSFDFVVASYSLYFFPQILADICRVMRDGALLLAVTHSEGCCRSLMAAAGFGGDSPLTQLVRRFSGENGTAQLSPWFAEIESIRYPNDLRFQNGELEDLLTYIRFKLPLAVCGSDSSSEPELPAFVEPNLRAHMDRAAVITVEKDDAIFRCRRPLCR
jgi:ubiquinone/menaquinone biosynthesis C-methylase UbiE